MSADRELYQHSAILNRAAGGVPWAPGALAEETRAAADQAMAELDARVAADAGVTWLLGDPHQLPAVDPATAQGATAATSDVAVRDATTAADAAQELYVVLDRGDQGTTDTADEIGDDR